MKKYALILFISFLFFENIYGQKIGQRITMNLMVGPQTADKNNSPISFNAGLETKMKVNEYFHLCIKYENGLFDFGREIIYGSTEGRYRIRDSNMKNMRRLGLAPIVDFSEYRNSFFFGVGFFYSHYPGTTIYTHRESGEVVASSTTLPQGAFTRSFIFGAKYKKWNMGLSYYLDSKLSNEYIQFWTGYEIISACPNKRIKYNNKTQLKRLLFEMGVKWNVPLNPSRAATTTIIYSPKFVINNHYSIGLEIEQGSLSNGGDLDFDVYYSERRGTIFQNFRRYDKLSRMTTVSLFMDKYEKYINGYFFYGAGLGLVTIEGLPEKSGFDSNGKEIFFEKIDKKRTVGFQGRCGIKAGAFRPSISLNMGVGNIPVYASFRLGIELGLFKKKKNY